jgi:nitroreductase
MRTLRAVRRLRPDPIPLPVLTRVLEAATWAPTGGNAQPWRVLVVRDAAKKRRLGELYAARWNAYSEHHRKLIADSPPAVVDAAVRMMRAGDHLAAHFGELPAVLIFCFNPMIMAITDAKLSRPSVVGGASVYPAVQNLMLACRAEGLGCVLTTLLCLVESEVRELLAMPDPWYTAAAVPIGYPFGKGHGPLSRKPVAKMVYGDAWGESIL